jgi:ASC-1-like (ASCH) protein
MNVKHISQPWFGYILSGKKTYEGRVNVGFWKTLVSGSRFCITDGDKRQEVEVNEMLYFRDFGEAWIALRDSLLPGVGSKEDAVRLYERYYAESDIQNHGVIVIKLNLKID